MWGKSCLCIMHFILSTTHSPCSRPKYFNGQWTRTSWRQDQTTEISIIFGRAQMEERGSGRTKTFWAGNRGTGLKGRRNAMQFNGNGGTLVHLDNRLKSASQCNGNGRPSSTSLDDRLKRTSQCNALGRGSPSTRLKSASQSNEMQ